MRSIFLVATLLLSAVATTACSNLLTHRTPASRQRPAGQPIDQAQVFTFRDDSVLVVAKSFREKSRKYYPEEACEVRFEDRGRPAMIEMFSDSSCHSTPEGTIYDNTDCSRFSTYTYINSVSRNGQCKASNGSSARSMCSSLKNGIHGNIVAMYGDSSCGNLIGYMNKNTDCSMLSSYNYVNSAEINGKCNGASGSSMASFCKNIRDGLNGEGMAMYSDSNCTSLIALVGARNDCSSLSTYSYVNSIKDHDVCAQTDGRSAARTCSSIQAGTGRDATSFYSDGNCKSLIARVGPNSDCSSIGSGYVYSTSRDGQCRSASGNSTVNLCNSLFNGGPSFNRQGDLLDGALVAEYENGDININFHGYSRDYVPEDECKPRDNNRPYDRDDRQWNGHRDDNGSHYPHDGRGQGENPGSSGGYGRGDGYGHDGGSGGHSNGSDHGDDRRQDAPREPDPTCVDSSGNNRQLGETWSEVVGTPYTKPGACDGKKDEYNKTQDFVCSRSTQGRFTLGQKKPTSDAVEKKTGRTIGACSCSIAGRLLKHGESQESASNQTSSEISNCTAGSMTKYYQVISVDRCNDGRIETTTRKGAEIPSRATNNGCRNPKPCSEKEYYVMRPDVLAAMKAAQEGSGRKTQLYDAKFHWDHDGKKEFIAGATNVCEPVTRGNGVSCSPQEYLSMPDLRAAGVKDAFNHFLHFGHFEDRCDPTARR